MSRNFTRICALGQSQPVSMACLKSKNSTSLSKSEISSNPSDFSSLNQTASLPFVSVIPLSAKNASITSFLAAPASAFGN